MTVFIDDEYKCHVIQMDGTKPVNAPYFADKCTEYIEGYRFIPAGESWMDKNGMTHSGEMAFPWKPFAELDAAQREYERELARVALIMLGEV